MSFRAESAGLLDEVSLTGGISRPDQLPIGGMEAIGAGFAATLADSHSFSESRVLEFQYEERARKLEKLGVDKQSVSELYGEAYQRTPQTTLRAIRKLFDEGEIEVDAHGAPIARTERARGWMRSSQKVVQGMALVERVAREHPGEFASDSEIYARGAELMRAERERTQGLLARHDGALAPFVGATGAALTDPWNLATLPIGGGAIQGGKILANAGKAFALEAGLAGLSESAIQAQTAEMRQSLLGEEMSLAEQATNVLSGMVGAGVLRASGSLAIDVFALRKAAARARQEGNAGGADVLEDYADTLAENPVADTLAGQQAHLDAIEKARADLEAGRAPDVEAFLGPHRGEAVPSSAELSARLDEVGTLVDDFKARSVEQAREAGIEAPPVPPAKIDLDAENFGMPEPPRTLAEDDPLLVETVGLRTPEREALRARIVEEQVASAAPVAGRKPVAYLMGGGGASGKGTVLKALQESGFIPRDGIAKLDPDEIKAALPEYEQIIKAGDARAAAVVHEESSALAKRALAAAMEKRADIVLDRTLGDGAKGRAEIEALKAAGYEVRLVGVTTDAAVAVERAAKRARRSNRWVPMEALIKAHAGFARHFEEYAALADEVRLFDNNGDTPALVGEGKAGKFAIVDEGLYNRFRGKEKLSGQEKTLRQLGAGPGLEQAGRGAEGPRVQGSVRAGQGQPQPAAAQPRAVPAEGLAAQLDEIAGLDDPIIAAAIREAEDLLARSGDTPMPELSIDGDGTALAVRPAREVFAEIEETEAGLNALSMCALTKGVA